VIRQTAKLADSKTGLAHDQKSSMEDPMRLAQAPLELRIDERRERAGKVGRELREVATTNQLLRAEAGDASFE
jgi:hypothetical protein